jgi:hypothetical protein
MTLNAAEIAAMQETVTDVQLAHTCTIERDLQVEADGWGNADVPQFTDYLTGVRCWHWIAPTQNAIYKRPPYLGTPDAMVDSLNLVLPAGTDVTERDRIKEVRDADGNAVAGQLAIREVRRRLNHLHLILHEVR